METTDKITCRTLVSLMYEHGVRHVVLSPGSRNAPLIVAVSRHAGMEPIVVIDERSAAFVGIGLAAQSGRPVALVCTSGTAVLNYGPALAEAYYRQIPLVAISADRPVEWIDQDDSQTIRQDGVLSNVVKGSYDIPVETGNRTQEWFVNRIINDALLLAQSGPKGPVHINMQLDVPLDRMSSGYPKQRVIGTVFTEKVIPKPTLDMLRDEISQCAKVMIIAGYLIPDKRIDRALQNIMSYSQNVIVLHEAQSNLRGSRFINNIDSTLGIMTEREKDELRPDMVITIGGSLVSRFIKDYLRDTEGLRHWHVGEQPYSVDCFKALEQRVEMDAASFLLQLEKALCGKKTESDYADRWTDIAGRAVCHGREYALSCPWSDYKAMACVMKAIPHGWNVQLSNGTVVRYAQLFDCRHLHRIDCNRGVSGIDGSTSTAIGASVGYDGTTLLITGDMSAQYDIGALAAACVPAEFKMIVLNNNGGGIFRFIQATSSLPELEQYFAADVRLPLRQLSDGYGYAYFEACDETSFAVAFDSFAKESDRPAILNIITPAKESSEVLRKYFEHKKL